MKKLYLFIMLSSATAAYAQSPGGVSGVSLWLKADRINPIGSYRDYSGNETSVLSPTSASAPKYDYMNFNDAFMFDGQGNHLEAPFVMENLDRVSMFTTYQNTDTGRERALVSSKNGERKEIEYGTANIFRYNSDQINYLDPNKIDSTASFAMYSKFDTPSTRITDVRGSRGISTLYIGKDVGSKGWLPFKGRIPEFFVYRKILTLNERMRVNSYLAVKYGITIPYTEYLSSKSVKIWRKEDYEDYPINVAGIARDRFSDLYQKQSGSTSDGGRLFISVGDLAKDNRSNTSEFSDQTFLIWGSDTNPIEFEDGKAGYQLLKRKWKARMTSEGNIVLPTQVRFKIEDIQSKIPEGATLRLLLDRSGKGIFSGSDTEIYKTTEIDKEGYAVFKDVVFDRDGNGTDNFTFGIGSELMALQDISQPTCITTSGYAKIVLQGGVPPYAVTLTGEKAGGIYKMNSDKATLSFQGLAPDHYRLYAMDAKGSSTTSQFSINGFSSFTLDIPTELTIKKGGFADIDASKNLGVQDASYEWTSSKGFRSNTAKVRLYEPGNYTVTVTTADGCRKSKSVIVNETLGTGIVVYPNPVALGEQFTVHVILDKKQDTEISIYDMSGRLVKSWKGHDKSEYKISDSISVQGVYVILVVTPIENKAFKLIVN